MVTSPCPVVAPAADDGEMVMVREASSSASVAVTVVLVTPGPVRVKVLDPLTVSPSLPAETVTVCGVAQFEVVKESDAGDPVRSASPLPEIATDVVVAGAPERATVNVLLAPSGTVREAGVTTMAGAERTKLVDVQSL